MVLLFLVLLEILNNKAAAGRNLVCSVAVAGYNDCVLDGDVLLSLAGSEDDFIEQEINGFAGGYTRPEKFKDPTYM